jgi:hypothetical protein
VIVQAVRQALTFVGKGKRVKYRRRKIGRKKGEEDSIGQKVEIGSKSQRHQQVNF